MVLSEVTGIVPHDGVRGDTPCADIDGPLSAGMKAVRVGQPVAAMLPG
jgi:hypothetical protein